MTKETKILEPIKIEAYTCPVCKEVLVMPYEKAKEHVNVKIDRTRLPEGLIYLEPKIKSENIYYRIIFSHKELSSDHSLLHHIETYSLIKPIDTLNDIIDMNMTYRDILSGFNKGKYLLLSEDEFNFILPYFGIKRILRTFSKIENPAVKISS